MTSVVEICNQALELLRPGLQIISLDDPSEQARSCKTIYASVRDTLLVQDEWNFALRKRLLQKLGTGDYYYQIPPDCLRVVRIESESFYFPSLRYWTYDYLHYPYQSGYGIGYTVESNSIYIPDINDPEVVYIARIENTNFMPEDFKEVLVYALAVRLSSNYGSARQEYLTNLYHIKLANLRETNAKQTRYAPAAPWNEARRWGGRY